MNEAAAHALVAGALVIAAAVLSALGHDATPFLALLGGQGLGAGVSKLARPPKAPPPCP